MTTDANWLNIDPIEEEEDPPLTPVIQPPLQKLGGTIWFGQQSTPAFVLNLDLPLPKGK